MATVRELKKMYRETQALAAKCNGDAKFYDCVVLGSPLSDTFSWGYNVMTELYYRNKSVRFVLALPAQFVGNTNTHIYRTVMRSSDRTLVAFLFWLNQQALKQRPKVTSL